MKQTLFFFAGTLLLASNLAMAAEICTVCPVTDEILKKIEAFETAHGKPEPTDEFTIQEQQSIANMTYKVARANLNEKHFTAANAKGLVKAITRTIPYEPSMDLERDTMEDFHRLYNKRGSLLKATIADLVKSGELTAADEEMLLEAYGWPRAKGKRGANLPGKKAPVAVEKKSPSAHRSVSSSLVN